MSTIKHPATEESERTIYVHDSGTYVYNHYPVSKLRVTELLLDGSADRIRDLPVGYRVYLFRCNPQTRKE
jgi:hypothetical protein